MSKDYPLSSQFASCLSGAEFDLIISPDWLRERRPLFDHLIFELKVLEADLEEKEKQLEKTAKLSNYWREKYDKLVEDLRRLV